MNLSGNHSTVASLNVAVAEHRFMPSFDHQGAEGPSIGGEDREVRRREQRENPLVVWLWQLAKASTSLRSASIPTGIGRALPQSGQVFS